MYHATGVDMLGAGVFRVEAVDLDRRPAARAATRERNAEENMILRERGTREGEGHA
jgi:hypothetical protein